MEVAEVYRLELRGSAHMAKALLLFGLASAALTLGGAALAAESRRLATVTRPP